MNPLIKYSKEMSVKEPIGSGRFYARLSQSELLPAPVPGGIERVLLFDAFDSQWFANNPPPDSSEKLAEYYDAAPLFLLVARVLPSHTKLFAKLEDVVKASD